MQALFRLVRVVEAALAAGPAVEWAAAALAAAGLASAVCWAWQVLVSVQLHCFAIIMTPSDRSHRRDLAAALDLAGRSAPADPRIRQTRPDLRSSKFQLVK
jgi:hypothetical protein